MYHTGRHLPHMLRIALLLLLLSMQSYSLAHELDSGAVHDGSVCLACSVGSNHNAVTQSHFEPAATRQTSQYFDSYCTAGQVFTLLISPEARAPPSSL